MIIRNNSDIKIYLIDKSRIKEYFKMYGLDVNSNTLERVNELFKEIIVDKAISNAQTMNKDIVEEGDIDPINNEILIENFKFKAIVDEIIKEVFEQVKSKGKPGNKGVIATFLVFLISSIFLPITTNILTRIEELLCILFYISIVGLITSIILLLYIQLHLKKK